MPSVLPWNWVQSFAFPFLDPGGCKSKCHSDAEADGLYELVEWMWRANQCLFVAGDSRQDHRGPLEVHIERSSNGTASFGFAYNSSNDTIYMMGFWLQGDGSMEMLEAQFIIAALAEFSSR